LSDEDAPELFDTLLAGVASSPPIAPRAQPQKLGRFTLLRELGQGAFGVVFEAEDDRDGSRVALKLLRNEHPEWIYRFKREFRALADLSHENLVRLDELTSDAGRWYFTMELVRGLPFLEAVRAKPERLTRAFADLARGLSALHDAGKLHRDVKPSNVLVDERDRLVLLDFGLAMDLSQEQSVMMAGTPYYMSPEQHGYAELTPASDWYALGVILYEALAGRGPFEGSIAQLVAQKRAGRVLPPSELGAVVPPELEALCLALLSVDPGARPSGPAILERLRGEAAPESRIEPAAAELFVGRALELAALRRAFDDSRQGTPVLALLAGASGMGKSAILKQFVDGIRREFPAAVVLSGRCYERETVPYKAIDGVVDELGRMLARLPPTEVAALLPRDVDALGQVFPVLRRIETISGARHRASVDRNEQRRRGMGALRELIARIADRQPLLIAVDDLQWGDADSVALMAELLRPPDPPALLFVGVFRGEERKTSPLLSGLQELRGSTLSSLDAREIPVGELAPEDAVELVASLLAERRADAALAERITAESAGCPFLVHELVRQRAQGGAPSIQVEMVLLARVAQLDVPTRRLLEVVALSGEPIERSVARTAAALGEQMRLPIATLRSEHLIRMREIGGDECIEPYHDRIRQAVLRGVSSQDAARLHRQLAVALEQSGQAAPERIATHLAGAGAFERAAELMLVAARSATEALAFDHAASLLRQVLELRDRQSGSRAHDRRELLCELADALVEAGKGAEAADVYISAARGANEDTAFELKRRAADQLLMAGHMERGREVLAALLSNVGLRLPTSHWAALGVLPQRARLKLRGLSFVPRDESQVPKRDLHRIDVLLGAVFGFLSSDPPTAFFLGSELVRRALDAGEPRRVLDALVLEAFLQCMMGSGGESARKAVVKVARQIGTPAAHHMRLTTEGAIASLLGRWKEALRSYDEADAWGREHNTRSTLFGNRALFFRFDALYWTGQVDTAARGLPPLIQDLHERGNIMGWLWMSLIWAWVTCAHGKPDEAREIVDNALRVWGKGGILPHWWRMLNDTNFALYEGDGDRARELVSNSPILGIKLLVVGREGRVQYQWSCARAAIAAAVARKTDRLGLINEAEKRARSLGREGSPMGNAIEPSLLAAIAALRGRRSEAVAFLEHAERRLRALDMEMMVASVQRARGQLGSGESASRAMAESDLWMSQQKIAEPGRFAAMYLPGPWTGG